MASCSGDSKEEEGEKTNPFQLEEGADILPVSVKRLDLDIAGYVDADSTVRQQIINDNYEDLWYYGQMADNVDSVDNYVMLTWSSSPVTTQFVPEIKQVFPTVANEEKALGRILLTARKNNIELPVTRFVAVAWGDSRSVILADTIETAFVALNHYLGADSPAYEGWPDYKKKLKKREMLPVDVSEALVASAIPYKTEGENTVLSRLLYEGSLAVAKEAMVPSAPLSDILGFTPAELADIKKNESVMWKRLVADNKLYSTDAELISNLFDLRPTSSVISPDAPGRAVRYIGYRIVRAYLAKNPDATLAFILSPAFYDNGRTVLQKANYSPETAH